MLLVLISAPATSDGVVEFLGGGWADPPQMGIVDRPDMPAVEPPASDSVEWPQTGQVTRP